MASLEKGVKLKEQLTDQDWWRSLRWMAGHLWPASG